MPEFIKGKVKKVFVKEMTAEAKARDIHDSTHTHKLQMDNNQWFNFGGSKNDAFFVKGVGLLGEGSEVAFVYEENTVPDKKNPGQTVTFRNAKKGQLTIIDFVEGKKWDGGAQQSNQAGGAQSNAAPKQAYKPKDYTGVKVGHAINGALYYYGHDINKPILVLAKMVHNISEELAATWKEENPKMSDYDVGASVGHAVLNACKANKLIKKKKADPDMTEAELKDYALKILPMSKEVEDFIRNGPAEVDTATQEQPKVDPYADFDDDIPF